MRLPSADPLAQRRLIEEEGGYDSIEEWDAETPTALIDPQKMSTLVWGQPRSPNFSVSIETAYATIDEILQDYLRS